MRRAAVPPAPHRPPLWPGRRALGLLLAATFALGAVAHEVHHLQDPSCGAAGSETHHFCPCAGLHASSLVSPETPVPSAETIAERLAAPRTVVRHEAERVARDDARAPPRT